MRRAATKFARAQSSSLPPVQSQNRAPMLLQVYRSPLRESHDRDTSLFAHTPLEPSTNMAALGGLYVGGSDVLGPEAAPDDDRWDELQRAEADEFREVDR